MMTDIMKVFENPKYGAPIEQLKDFLSESNRAFLLGAGCSKCAKLPLMNELTTKVIDGLKDESKKVLEAVKNEFDPSVSKANIEDFMSEIVDWLSIANRRIIRNATKTVIEIGGIPFESDILAKAIEDIKIQVVRNIASDKIDTTIHRQFIDAVHQHLFTGKELSKKHVSYFILNYDRLIEDSLALERILFSDGFQGGAVGWWSPETYSSAAVKAKVYKLHGSIDWCLSDSTDPFPQKVRIRNLPEESDKHFMIWPAATKYRETQNDPFAALISMFRSELKLSDQKQTVLTICGYSFGDSHINYEIDHALRNSGKHLTVIAFTESNEPEGQLKKWMEDPDLSEQLLVYANRGFYHGNKVITSDEDLPWWQFEILTKLLRGEQ